MQKCAVVYLGFVYVWCWGWDMHSLHVIFYIFVVYICCLLLRVPSSPPLYLMKYRESYRYCNNWRGRNRTPTEWDIVKHAIFFIFVVYCCRLINHYIQCAPPISMIHFCRFTSFATTRRSPLPIRHPKSEILSSMPYFIYLLSSRRLRRMKYRESYCYCYNWRSRNRTPTEWDIVKHVIFYIFVVYCCGSPHLPPSI